MKITAAALTDTEPPAYLFCLFGRCVIIGAVDRFHPLQSRGYGARLGDGSTAMPEPWPGAWDDYADALEAIAEGGVAAGVDNAAFLTDPSGAHWLLDPAFYDAVLGRDWCWFYRRAPGLLADYDDWRWWPAIPERVILDSP